MHEATATTLSRSRLISLDKLRRGRGKGGEGGGGRGGKVEKGGLEYAVLFLSVSVVRLYEGDVLSMSCTHNCTFRGLILAERSREQTRRSTYRNIG